MKKSFSRKFIYLRFEAIIFESKVYRQRKYKVILATCKASMAVVRVDLSKSIVASHEIDAVSTRRRDPNEAFCVDRPLPIAAFCPLIDRISAIQRLF